MSNMDDAHEDPAGPSADREAYLIESGAYTPHQLAWAKAAIEHGALSETELRTRQKDLDGTETVSDVAARLEIENAAIDECVTRGELLAYMEDGVLRFPKWQFAEAGSAAGTTVTHLAELIAATRELHPSTISAIMSNRQDELRIKGERVTPVQWLARGCAVQDVIDIFEAYLWS
jgi:hypothetical protein